MVPAVRRRDALAAASSDRGALGIIAQEPRDLRREFLNAFVARDLRRLGQHFQKLVCAFVQHETAACWDVEGAAGDLITRRRANTMLAQNTKIDCGRHNGAHILLTLDGSALDNSLEAALT